MAYLVNLAYHCEIDGIPLSTPAWEHVNLYALLAVGAVRGENVVMPGAVGRRPVRRRTDQMTATIEMAFFGDFDWTGAPQADGRQGLARNLAEFKSTVVDPTITVDSVRTAIIHLPSGAVSAGIQILGFEFGEAYNPTAMSASMDVAVLQGQFL